MSLLVLNQIFSSKKIFASILLGTLLIISVFTVVLQINKNQEIRKKAAKQEIQKKPEDHTPGTVIVKYKEKANIPLYSDDKPLEKGPVAIAKVNTKKLNVTLKKLDDKYKNVTVEKVFSGIEKPEKELSKIKLKFQSQLTQKQKTIDENLFIRTDLSRVFRVSFDRQVPVDIVLQEFLQDPEVEYAEPDIKYQAFLAVNDKYFLDPNPSASERDLVETNGGWNPKKTDGSNLDYQWNLKKIGFPGAWDYLGENKETVVAVIDTGVDYNHEEFQGRIWENDGEKGTDGSGKDKKSNSIDDDNNGYIDDWRGWDSIFYGYNCFGFTCASFKLPDNNPMDDWREPYFTGYKKGGGHGTHVAGLIGANSNNTIGIAGMNPSVKIMALRGLTAEGEGYSSQLAKLIAYAASNGAKVINMSWGGGGTQVISDAIDFAYSQGVVLVAAAGNSGRPEVIFPASHPRVVAVGAIDEADHITNYSSYGSKLSVVAPGGRSRASEPNPRSILSLRGDKTDIYCLSDTDCIQGRIQQTKQVVGQDLKYYRAAGTSMAAPHVSGLASMIFSKNPLLTADQVRSIIEYTADDLGALDKDEKYGYGKINAERALREFSSNPPPIALLSEPYDREHLYYGNFEIKGTVSSDQFKEFRIEYAPLENKDSWSSNGVTLVGAGTSGIQNGLLGTWDSGNLTGKYYLKLTAVDKENRERSHIITVELVNGILKSSFPKSFPYSYDYLETNHVLISDIDNDGTGEIIKAIGERVYVYKTNGENFNSSFPVNLGSTVSFIAVGDIDSSYTGKEIVVKARSGFTGIEPGGIKYINLAGVTKDISSNTIFRGNLADINNDGLYEIIAYESGYTGPSVIHALDKNGIDVSNFPVNYINPITETYWNSSAIRTGDINGDELDDIVINIRSPNYSGINRLLAISGDGKLMWDKELYTGFGNINQFTLADLDQNGQLEVLFLDVHQIDHYPWASYKLYVLKGDGVDFFQTDPDLSQIGSARVFVTDTNGDRNLEVLLLGWRNYGIITEKGNLTIANYPSDFDVSFTPVPVESQTIGGLTGNNKLNLFGSSQLYVLPKGDWPQITNEFISSFLYENGNFALQVGYPKGVIADLWTYGGSGSMSYVAVADTDGNGKSEKIFYYCLKRKNNCYLYNLEDGSQLTKNGWYQYLHDERHSGAYKDIIVPTPTPTPTLIPTPTPDKSNSPPIVMTGSLARGFVGKKYAGTITGSDVNKDDQLKVKITNLPDDISVGTCNEQIRANRIKYINCALSGIPKKVGTYPVTIKIEDNRGGKDEKTVSLEIR